MNPQDVAIYKEIQRNTDMAMKAIDTIGDKVYDDNLALQISRQSLKYSELFNEATKELIAAKADTYQSGAMEDIMLKAGIHMNTFLDTSTNHIAEQMIKGSNMGVLEMEKILHQNEGASEKPVALAQELLDFEEKNIERLKSYL